MCLADNLSCFILHHSRSKLSTYTLSSPHNSMPSQSVIPLTTPRGMHWRYRQNEVEGSCECGCAPTSCHNWLKLRNNIEIYMFSYLQVLENYLLWYKIYSSYFWVIFIRNSCGKCV